MFGAPILKADTGRGAQMDCYDCRISTIPEALAELGERTRRVWTESEFFDVVIRYGIELHAAAPATAQTTTKTFVIGRGMMEINRPADYNWLLAPHIVPNSHSGLAALFPAQVNQIRISGETLASHTSDHDKTEGETRLFIEPVRVTREQVRVKAATLEKILKILNTVQTPDAPAAAKGEAGQVTPGKNMEQEQVELSLTDVVRINEAAEVMGCTVEYLLREAGNDEHLLYVALKPHSAKLCAIRSHTNPQNGSYTTKSHKIVVMAQHYAESLAIAGSAEIAQYQAGFIKGGILDWHYWMLDVPQTVNVDMVFVPRSQLPDAPAAKGKAAQGTNPNGERWEEQARTIADECFNRDTANGCRDSLKGYSMRVMELMQERDVKEPRGIFDSPGTIMREALQSKKWWANKSK